MISDIAFVTVAIIVYIAKGMWEVLCVLWQLTEFLLIAIVIMIVGMFISFAIEDVISGRPLW